MLHLRRHPGRNWNNFFLTPVIFWASNTACKMRLDNGQDFFQYLRVTRECLQMLIRLFLLWACCARQLPFSLASECPAAVSACVFELKVKPSPTCLLYRVVWQVSPSCAYPLACISRGTRKSKKRDRRKDWLLGTPAVPLLHSCHPLIPATAGKRGRAHEV